MRRLRPAGLLAFLSASACAAPAQTLQLTDCAVPGLEVAGRCGSYQAWEDREARQGRRISLNIVVIPAQRGPRREDPVLYLAGGPGASATASIPGNYRVLAEINQTRDLVFIDVRGTGQSHPLSCPLLDDSAGLQVYFDDLFQDDYVRACLAGLDADPSFYTNPMAMDDLDEVRAALGYRQVNLFGASGGTRAAQVYMKRHPGSIRAVVLHGVAPMDGEIPLAAPKAMEAAIVALFGRCVAEPTCRSSYPRLAAEWEQVKTAFAGGPVRATVTDERTGRRGEVRISQGVFADGIRHLMYGMGAARILPELIHRASRGDYSLFAERELGTRLNYQNILAYGAYLSYTCAEDLAFVTEADVRRATEATFLGDYRVRRQLAACRLWPKGKGVDPDYQQPVRSTIPTLLISGDVDVATPAADGERVARHLSRSRHVVFPNQSHAPANPACMARLMTEFFETRDPGGLDVGCVGR